MYGFPRSPNAASASSVACRTWTAPPRRRHDGAAGAGITWHLDQSGETAMTRLRLRAIPVLRITVWARGSRALGRRPRRSLPAGRRLPAGAVLTGLALLGASVPASGQTLTWSLVPS